VPLASSSSRGRLSATWLSLAASRFYLRPAIALNALNRSMGLAEAYPFVMPEPAAQKLRFVHQVIEASAIQ
jgi:hypothetical protein